MPDSHPNKLLRVKNKGIPCTMSSGAQRHSLRGNTPEYPDQNQCRKRRFLNWSYRQSNPGLHHQALTMQTIGPPRRSKGTRLNEENRKSINRRRNRTCDNEKKLLNSIWQNKIRKNYLCTFKANLTRRIVIFFVIQVSRQN